ncbi:MAG: ABC-F family ATP-binding cassette domain-containing protein [Aureispira sp.]|nr:ABC-F family ATP-binding cassette domain-containing protein [Aureispira sp.]
MLGINNVFVKYGDRTVLNNITFSIFDGDRIGLVGRNGAGKSTMLKIISGAMSPHSGSVAFPKGATVGFLHQDMSLPKGKTVMEETLTALQDAQETQKEIDKLNDELMERTDYDSESYMDLLNQLDELNERLRVMGGATLEVDAQKILMGLGFTSKDFNRLTDEFSGGWQMRIELSKMLLQNPTYLLLDEPTNHLDIESIIWLEEFLQTYEGSVIVISHDKTFLDNVTKRTIEIELGNAYDYKANYSKYLALRAERQSKMKSAYENQQKEIAHKERLIEKFRAKANKAKMAQSLIKELARMDKIELEHTDSSKMKLKFPPAPRGGEVVASAKKVSKRYGDSLILDELDFEIIRGERVAFVGKNGEGKSTFSKILIEQLQHEGEAKLGYNVHLGYYAQNQAETLDQNLTVYETIEQVSPPEMRTKLRSILGSFLFSGEDIDKKVFVLSGGERARLALACLLLRPINFLVLDEPTNHLDMTSKNVLKQAILDYDGTLLVVSHDRDFLVGLTDKTIEFNNRKIKPYLGDIKYFLEKRSFDTFREVSLGKKEEKEATTSNKRPRDKAYNQELKKLKRAVQNAERRVGNLEESIEGYEKKMADTSIMGTPQYDDILKKYNQSQIDLEEAMTKWEEAEAVLTKFESE